MVDDSEDEYLVELNYKKIDDLIESFENKKNNIVVSNEISNPTTYDNIYKYFVFSVISSLSCIFVKKNIMEVFKWKNLLLKEG